jgi:O-antigen ligase
MLKESILGRGLLALFLIGISVAMGFLAQQGRELLGFIALFVLLGVVFLCLRPDIGIVLFLSSFFVTYEAFLPESGRFTLNNLLGLLFMVLLLVRLYREKDLWFLQERLVQIYGVLIILVVVSSLLAEQQGGNTFAQPDRTDVLLSSFVTRFVFLIFFINFIRTYHSVKLVYWLVVGFIVVSAFSALYDMASGSSQYRISASLGIRATGNANYLAFFCNFGIALIWYYRRLVRQKWQWFMLTTTVVVLAIAVLLSGSRGGLVCLLLLFVLISMAGRFSIKRQLQTVLVLVCVTYVASSVLTSDHIERLGNILPGASRETQGTSSIDDRIFILQNGLKMVAAHPLFGVGIGNFERINFQISRGASARPPHNSYLWAMAEGGLPVLFFFLLLYVYTFRVFWSVEQASRQPEMRALAAGLRTGLIIFLFFSLFASVWYNIIIYVIVSFAIVLKRLQQQERAANTLTLAPRTVYQHIPT